MKEMEAKGSLYYRTTGMPMLKHYLAEMPGVPLQTFWHDLAPIISGSPEGLAVSRPEGWHGRMSTRAPSVGEGEELTAEETVMGKGGRKRRARRKNAANHGKRPNA